MDDDAPVKAASSAPAAGEFPEYKNEAKKCSTFLCEYRDPQARGGRGPLKYVLAIAAIKKRESATLDIALDDVALVMDDAFVRAIESNVRRYVELFSSAADELLANSSQRDELRADDEVADVVRHHRLRQLADVQAARGEEAQTPEELAKKFPPALMRRYELRILPRTTDRPLSLREVASAQLGRLVQVKAMTLRATDVKPLMQVAAYSCDDCGYEIYQDVTGRTFMPVPNCVSPQCSANQSRGRVHMQTRVCKFVKYQELKVQELPEHVPVGNIPRTMTVVAKGASTRLVKAGDVVVLGGIFLPTPFTGFHAIRAGLTTDTYLEVMSISNTKTEDDVPMTKETEDLIAQVSEADPYSLLSRSLAPEIYGMEDVKKALLLQLISGETRQQGDGMRTRGDINICLMGDPGVAKSQLLKHIAKVAPRCVYTTGKGSSGVGLTAAVIRDAMTGELTLEGGALVLADRGICCIDEFDKMEEQDRTAIHEVMEQQSVSIAKAGITTTLNARTAILAAANPRYGRYNRLADRDAQTALTKNINLPAALLSRFDLLFLLLDETDSDNDRFLAEHITYVHKHEVHPPLDFVPFDPAFIRQYVAVVRNLHPTVPPELRDYIVEAYVDIRARDKARALEANSRATTTARHLLSILRLAEAHAKLHIREIVQQGDIDEAIRLMTMSKASVMESDTGRTRAADPISRMWEMIKEKLAHKPHFVAFAEAQAIALRAGHSQEDFERFVTEYEGLGIIEVNASRTRIDLATSGV